MKFLSFNTYHVDRLGDIAKTTAKFAGNPQEGFKILALYSCMGNPFPGVQLPQGTLVAVSVIESDNAEAMAAASLEMIAAGATIHRIPVLEVPTGGVQETVEKLRK